MELPTFFKKSSPSLSRRFNFSVPATASFKCSCTPATGDDCKNMEECCGKFSAKSTFSEAPTGKKNNPLERQANGPLAPSSDSSSSFSTGAGSAIAKPGAPGRSLIHGGIPGHPNGHPLVGPLGVSNLMGLINLHPPFFIWLHDSMTPWLHDSMIPFGTYDTHLRLHKAGMSHRSCDGMSVTKTAPAPKIEDCEGALPASMQGTAPRKKLAISNSHRCHYGTSRAKDGASPKPRWATGRSYLDRVDFSCQTEAGEENWAPCAKHHALRKRLEKEIHSTNRWRSK